MHKYYLDQIAKESGKSLEKLIPEKLRLLLNPSTLTEGITRTILVQTVQDFVEKLTQENQRSIVDLIKHLDIWEKNALSDSEDSDLMIKVKT
eukprot:UN13040